MSEEVKEVVTPEANGHTETEMPQDPVPVYDDHVPPFKFKVRNAKTGQVQDFELREFGPGDGARWSKEIRKRAKMKKSGRGVADFDFRMFQASGIAMCCYYGSTDNKVPRNQIETWGEKLKNLLFAKLYEMNGLDDESVDEEGKA